MYYNANAASATTSGLVLLRKKKERKLISDASNAIDVAVATPTGSTSMGKVKQNE
jgi:hypothetical protein